MKLTSITKTGSRIIISVSDELFALRVHPQVLAQAVRVYLANLRQGTSKVKTRGEIKRTKKKWFKQKGTGNARHGARSANIFVGGGVAHGPKGIENWSLKLTSKLKTKALLGALNVQLEKIFVIDYIKDLNGKTKEALTALSPIFSAGSRILVILPERNELVERGLRNISEVLIRTSQEVNALDILSADKIILTNESIKRLEARVFNKAKSKESKLDETAKAEVKDTKKVSLTAPAEKETTKAIAGKPTTKAAVKATTKATKPTKAAAKVAKDTKLTKTAKTVAKPTKATKEKKK